MAGQAGFLYEGRIHNRLKAKNLVPRGFVPAGSDANAPDAMFIFGGQSNKLEVKLDLKADYGQGSFEYSNGRWSLAGAKTAAAEELRGLMRLVSKHLLINSGDQRVHQIKEQLIMQILHNKWFSLIINDLKMLF
jgi:hypothetical protein